MSAAYNINVGMFQIKNDYNHFNEIECCSIGIISIPISQYNICITNYLIYKFSQRIAIFYPNKIKIGKPNLDTLLILISCIGVLCQLIATKDLLFTKIFSRGYVI